MHAAVAVSEFIFTSTRLSVRDPAEHLQLGIIPSSLKHLPLKAIDHGCHAAVPPVVALHVAGCLARCVFVLN